MDALPSLRTVHFVNMEPAHFPAGVDSDPLLPIFRRFLHRFPRVLLRLDFLNAAWQDSEELRVVQMRYVGCARVRLCCAATEERIGGPMSPHASDDDDGSDVEELIDPLAAEEH